jgi:YidC/Oxa1 family membrane protein insertase
MGLSTGPSFDQLMDEAKFHYVVKREPLRASSEAWTRVNGSGEIPEELKAWVGAGPKQVEEVETKSDAASVTA